LLPYLPIWTGVMRPHFNKSNEIASSSAVESEFNDLKNREFKGQLPMRVDKFIMQHLNYIDSKIIL
ncbi:120.7 kDa protein in NOF-FB transposable element, partial [Camponotus floridanus]